MKAKVGKGVVSLSLDELGMDEDHEEFTPFVIVDKETFLQLYQSGQIPEENLKDAEGRPLKVNLQQV